MLARAALRASRINSTSQARLARPSLASLNRLASSKTPSKPPPVASKFTASARAQNPPSALRSTIRNNGDAKTSSAPGATASSEVKSPVQGKRVSDPAVSSQKAVGNGAAPAAREPIAQQADLDTPPVGGIREATQHQQASAENASQPPETADIDTPQQPLPDLRQGIPSTFDLEFGQRKPRSSAQDDEASNITDREQAFSGRGRQGQEDEEKSRADFQTSLDKRRARLTRYSYLVVAIAVVFSSAWLSRPFSAAEDPPTGFDTADADGWAPGKMYRRVRARIGDRLGYYTEPPFPQLLPTVPEGQRAPYTLVLSMEDLMVHSKWDRSNGYRVAKRPGIDYFIRYLSPYYELVLFTTVPIGVADPIIKKLDPYHFIMWPLGREATKYDKGDLVKDLSYLNRDLNKTLIIDTVAGHVKHQPENAIVLPKWSGDPKDPHTNDLVALIPFLEYIATMNISDVREVIRSFEGKHIPTEFARREAIARAEFNKQLEEQKSKRPRRSLGSLFGGGLGIKADRSSGMILSDGQSVAEGLAQGKMLSDQIREQGQRQYEYLEKQIREQGAQWLKDEEEEQKRMMEEQMKEIKKNPLGSMGRFFGMVPPDSK